MLRSILACLLLFAVCCASNTTLGFHGNQKCCHLQEWRCVPVLLTTATLQRCVNNL
jgi:hypothetical protein